MSYVFCMDTSLFVSWISMLVAEQYDWEKNSISLKHCNNISVPKYGLELLDWTAKSFKVVDEKKYVSFLLRYR